MSRLGISSNTLKPHDLLWLDEPGHVSAGEVMPAWVSRVLARLPVVVVRRCRLRDGQIPIGVRGPSRNERFAAVAPVGCIAKHVAPEHLVMSRREPTRQRRQAIAALQAFFLVEKAWAGIGRPWGPTGSVGFELATGMPTATETSDLDLIIRAPSPLSKQEGRALLAAVARIDTVTDVRVETNSGSFALREYCDGHAIRLLVKTCDGPRLAADPWQSELGEIE